ncbi:MAG TPA: hypothetical protein VK797_22025 [Tepidisphaeraceae bacterium]|nr:hypothetical protein [Tepidisphaeraceae bacterium]
MSLSLRIHSRSADSSFAGPGATAVGLWESPGDQLGGAPQKEQTAAAAEDRGGLRIRDINLIRLLINFNVLHRKDGLERMVNKLEPSASLRALLRGEADD